MTVYRIDPLNDPRWERLLARQPRASIFHTPEWLKALDRTYGYKPVALTSSPAGCELADGLVLCYVESWLTGRRLVSVPFSDHCDLLSDRADRTREFLQALTQELKASRLKYIELRPVDAALDDRQGFAGVKMFWLHKIDLRPSLEALYCAFHKDCVSRKLRRAARESLHCDEGRSQALLRMFYHLMILTRRRHGLVPQPLAWFCNVVDCLGDKATIRVATANGQPVAAMMTLRYKNTLVYKYGCSDAVHNRSGGMQLLFWRAIQEAKNDGIVEFDLGRSDYDAAGLVAFKERWGGVRSTLTYWRYPAPSQKRHRERSGRAIKSLVARMPARALVMAGELLYKHAG